MAAKSKGEFDAPCRFGGVVFGDAVARVGVIINRDAMKFTQADKYLAGARLTISLESFGVQHDDGGPKPAGKKASASFQATVDIKGFNVKKKTFAFGLSFNTEAWSEKDKNSLVRFAKSHGHFTIIDCERLKEQTAIAFPPEDDGAEEASE